jgi:hypothetical protein
MGAVEGNELFCSVKCLEAFSYIYESELQLLASGPDVNNLYKVKSTGVKSEKK